jgi:hypothetical protein
MLRKAISLVPVLGVFSLPGTASVQSKQSAYGTPPIELYGGYSHIFKPYDSTSQTRIGDGFRSDDRLNLDPHALFFLLGP